MSRPSEPPALPRAAHEQAAWRTLVSKRADHLAFLRRRLPPSAHPDAEDILQLASMNAARHLDQLRAGEQLEPWFWRIVRNTLIDELRRSGRERDIVAALAIDTPPSVARETCGCSLDVLARLRPDYREVLRRADVDEEPIEAVAVGLGITVNNAAVRLHRARKAMRAALLDHCGSASLRSCQDCRCEGARAT
jgi:RNA polymerase sigma-70 factor (ECF subfamily)